MHTETHVTAVDQEMMHASTHESVVSTRSRSLLTQYYELTKPGITQMVVLTTLAGFYLAIPTDLVTFAGEASNWLLFAATMIGTVLVSAGACVFNHIMERDADARMKRTADRPIPSGSISVLSAAIFGAALTLVGIGLVATVSTLMVILAVATWLSYVVVYTPLKKRTSWALVVGGVPGALPFAAGWAAVTGGLEAPAIALFAILFFWQLPHFLALSWMYKIDYAQGGFVMTAIDDASGRSVGRQLIGTSVLTLAAAVLPTFLGATGWLYLTGATVLGLWLTFESVRFITIRDRRAARRVLLTSYAFLMGVIALIFVDKATTMTSLMN